VTRFLLRQVLAQPRCSTSTPIRICPAT